MNKIFALISLTLFIVSCYNSKNDADLAHKKVVSIMIDGSFDDKSFNESAWKGLQKIKQDMNVEIVGKDSTANAYLSDLEALKDKNSEIIWGVGFKLQDATFQSALLNKEIKYGVIDITYGDDVNIPENLIGVSFRVNEASFLAGFLAGKTTKTGKIGFLGGIQGEIVDSFRYGYEAGAKYANKDIEFISQYAGSFLDSSIGRSIASKMYGDGVDIIFAAAGPTGFGAIEVAKELGPKVLIIGVDQDQSHLAPDNILTSVVKNVGDTIYQITKTYLELNKIEGGKIVKLGLKEGAVSIVENPLKINEDLLKELAKIKENIINSIILVPNNEKNYNKFIMQL